MGLNPSETPPPAMNTREGFSSLSPSASTPMPLADATMSSNTSIGKDTALLHGSSAEPPALPGLATGSSTARFAQPTDPSRGVQTSIDDSQPLPKILRAHDFTDRYHEHGHEDKPMDSQRRSMHRFLQISRERSEERSRSSEERQDTEMPAFQDWDKYKQATCWQSRRDRDQAVNLPVKSAEQELSERRADGYEGPILLDTYLVPEKQDRPWNDSTTRSELPDKWCGRLAKPYGWAMTKYRLLDFWKDASFRSVGRHSLMATLDSRWALMVICLFLVADLAYLAAIFRDAKYGAWMEANAAMQPRLGGNWNDTYEIRAPYLVRGLVYVKHLFGWH